MSDGRYWLGPLAVDVLGGVARVADTQTIAGSTATMDHQFRFAVHNGGLRRDDAMMAAVRQSSINPARALGLPPAELKPGASADLVVLDTELAVHSVMRKGSWVS
jgi:N-acetylglucosamine-6-phosphate deacetylase